MEAAQEESDRVRRTIVARGFPYFAVYVDLVRHPKATDLAALVGSAPAALGYLVALWSFTAEFFGDGRIPNRPGVVETLERTAHWAGERGGLVAALVDAGFIDRTSRALTVHEWNDYQSPHVARRDRDRGRKRRNRAKERGSRPQTVPGRSPDAAVTRHLDVDVDVDAERDQDPASHSDPRSSTAEPLAAGWPGEKQEEGQDPSLTRFRADLATRLDVPTIGVGRDRGAVLAAVERRIRIAGRSEALNECVEAAGHIKANGHGQVANLAALVGWLNTLPGPGAPPAPEINRSPRPSCSAPAEAHTFTGRIEL